VWTLPLEQELDDIGRAIYWQTVRLEHYVGAACQEKDSIPAQLALLHDSCHAIVLS
jgi:hypothetical protein